MLELPAAISIKGRDGKMHDDMPMWTFWSLQEGTLGVDPKLQRTNDGKMPPVIHVDTDATLYSDVDRSTITDQLWGIYYKPDFNFGGIQGGAMPFKVKADPAKVKIDPYGPESPDFVVGDDFAHMWCSALAFCQKRFEGKMPLYKKEPSGGIGSFTADSFPVFDRFCDNVYVIADSNHGYKMIGVGELVAKDICGQGDELLAALPLLALQPKASCIRRPTARSRGADEKQDRVTDPCDRATRRQIEQATITGTRNDKT